MALCEMQEQNVWHLCKKTLVSQANKVNMGPSDRLTFDHVVPICMRRNDVTGCR